MSQLFIPKRNLPRLNASAVKIEHKRNDNVLIHPSTKNVICVDTF